MSDLIKYESRINQVSVYEKIHNTPNKVQVRALDEAEASLVRLDIMDIIDTTIKLFQPEMTKDQAQFLAETFMNYDPHKTIIEIKEIIRLGAIGKFGKWYGKFTPDLIGVWFDAYNLAYSIEIDINEGHRRDLEKSNLLEASKKMVENTGWTEEKRQQILEKKSDKKYNKISDYCLEHQLNYNKFLEKHEREWKRLHAAYDSGKDEKGRDIMSWEDYRNYRGRKMLSEMNRGKFSHLKN